MGNEKYLNVNTRELRQLHLDAKIGKDVNLYEETRKEIDFRVGLLDRFIDAIFGIPVTDPVLVEATRRADHQEKLIACLTAAIESLSGRVENQNREIGSLRRWRETVAENMQKLINEADSQFRSLTESNRAINRIRKRLSGLPEIAKKKKPKATRKSLKPKRGKA